MNMNMKRTISGKIRVLRPEDQSLLTAKVAKAFG